MAPGPTRTPAARWAPGEAVTSLCHCRISSQGSACRVPPTGAELTETVRASLGLLRLGALRVTAPLLAGVYRAVLGDADFSLHLAGPTGCYKSEAVALAQQHFGAGLDARHLPASWSSTGNALEGLAFAAKDALLVVDDFSPAGSSADVQRAHREADRLFRGQGNRSGRQRMRPDGTLRPTRPPRGLTLSTGEDVPRGQSLRARLWVVEVSPGDLGPKPPDPNPALTACQRHAAEGIYAAALAGFLCWLAPRYADVHRGLRAEAAELRERARGDGQHARTPAMVADLAIGLRYLLDFAEAVGAITSAEREQLARDSWAALREGSAPGGPHCHGGAGRPLPRAGVRGNREWPGACCGHGWQPPTGAEALGAAAGRRVWDHRGASAEAAGGSYRLAAEGRVVPRTRRELRRRPEGGQRTGGGPDRHAAHAASAPQREGLPGQHGNGAGTADGPPGSAGAAARTPAYRRGGLSLHLSHRPNRPSGRVGPGNGPISWDEMEAANARPAHQPAHEIGPTSTETGGVGRLGWSPTGEDSDGEGANDWRGDAWEDPRDRLGWRDR